MSIPIGILAKANNITEICADLERLRTADFSDFEDGSIEANRVSAMEGLKLVLSHYLPVTDTERQLMAREVVLDFADSSLSVRVEEIFPGCCKRECQDVRAAFAKILVEFSAGWLGNLEAVGTASLRRSLVKITTLVQRVDLIGFDLTPFIRLLDASLQLRDNKQSELAADLKCGVLPIGLGECLSICRSEVKGDQDLVEDPWDQRLDQPEIFEVLSPFLPYTTRRRLKQQVEQAVAATAFDRLRTQPI